MKFGEFRPIFRIRNTRRPFCRSRRRGALTPSWWRPGGACAAHVPGSVGTESSGPSVNSAQAGSPRGRAHDPIPVLSGYSESFVLLIAQGDGDLHTRASCWRLLPAPRLPSVCSSQKAEPVSRPPFLDLPPHPFPILPQGGKSPPPDPLCPQSPPTQRAAASLLRPAAQATDPGATLTTLCPSRATCKHSRPQQPRVCRRSGCVLREGGMNPRLPEEEVPASWAMPPVPDEVHTAAPTTPVATLVRHRVH